MSQGARSFARGRTRSLRLVAVLIAGAVSGCGAHGQPPQRGSQGEAGIPPEDAGVPEEQEPTAALCRTQPDAEPCGVLKAMIQPLALPAALGNPVADSFDASVLGFKVFFDLRFSRSRTVRCESCHSVDYGFADNKPVPTAGVGPGVRNSPTIFNAARHSVFMWDGRVDSLWSQPLHALENPAEMNFTRLELARAVGSFYKPTYEKVFGPLPDFSDLSRFPAMGKPGDPDFDKMAAEDQLAVDRVAANVGKALEAYMRNLATGPSPVDRYLAEMFNADPGYQPPMGAAYAATDGGVVGGKLTPQQERGLLVFVNAGCADCHSGDRLSDDNFYDLGVPALPGSPVDEGRTTAIVEALANDPFNVAGPFFEGPPSPSVTAPAGVGAFRTPSLRNLTRAGPYGHNGVFSTLEEVVDFHLSGGGVGSSTVSPKLKKVDLSAKDRAALLELLKALDGDYPKLPWGQWPSGNG